MGWIEAHLSYMFVCSSPLGTSSYPMSRFVASFPGHGLNYDSKELACHAKEIYIQRLKGFNFYITN